MNYIFVFIFLSIQLYIIYYVFNKIFDFNKKNIKEILAITTICLLPFLIILSMFAFVLFKRRTISERELMFSLFMQSVKEFPLYNEEKDIFLSKLHGVCKCFYSQLISFDYEKYITVESIDKCSMDFILKLVVPEKINITEGERKCMQNSIYKNVFVPVVIAHQKEIQESFFKLRKNNSKQNINLIKKEIENEFIKCKK